MSRERSSFLVVTVRVDAIACSGLGAIPCRRCGVTLDLCQPDPNLPERFIATCDECGEWSLVESSPDRLWATVVSLDALANLGPGGPDRDVPDVGP